MSNKAMKTFLLLCSSFLSATVLLGQYREPVKRHAEYLALSEITQPSQQKTIIPGLLLDQSQNYRIKSPIPVDQYLVNTRPSGHFAWIGNVTSQSFNNGKFGTYYYWDMQGNLQGTRGFIDLAGKNKRGFKLLFPWR